MTRKRSVVNLQGTAKYKKTKTKVNLEIKITDAVYEVEIMKEDIRSKRLWLESQPDGDGWTKLLYSADGPSGDPISVGKIRFEVDAEKIDPNFRDFSDLKLHEPKEE